MAIWNDSDHCMEHDTPIHSCVACKEKERDYWRDKARILEAGIKVMIQELREEIVRQEGRPNIGKKGCLVRLETLIK